MKKYLYTLIILAIGLLSIMASPDKTKQLDHIKGFYLYASFYGSNYLNFTWGQTNDATNYILSFSESSNGTYSKIYSGSGLSYFHQVLKPDTTYYYKLSAVAGGKNISLPVFMMRTIPVRIQFNGITVYGFISNLTAKPMVKFPGYDKSLIITSTTASNFLADSYFIIKGTNYFTGKGTNQSVGYPRIAFVLEAPDQSNVSWSFVDEKGYFEKLIFLRYGTGTYKLKVYKKPNINEYWHYLAVMWITNSRTNDFRYLMPSETSQSFYPQFRALAVQIAGMESNPSNIAVLFHDYIIKTVHFDNEVYEGYSKPQDALNVLKRGSAVCAGYAHLYAAMLRVMNIPVKYIAGKTKDVTNINHAWNEVWWGTNWHIIVVSWDDPLINGHSDYPDGSNIRWKYFSFPKSSILTPFNEKE